jgi:hypothetical protein
MHTDVKTGFITTSALDSLTKVTVVRESDKTYCLLARSVKGRPSTNKYPPAANPDGSVDAALEYFRKGRFRAWARSCNAEN